MLYKLNNILFDQANHTLAIDETKVTLEPKVFGLLSVLVAANGNLVSREQLIEQVWLGRIVGDSAINRTVSLLRQHFSSLDSEQVYIETVPRAGYLFIGDIAKVDNLAAPPRLSAGKANVSQIAQKWTANRSNRQRLTAILVLVIVIIFAISLSHYWSKEKSPQQVKLTSKLVPLTSAVDFEYNLSLENSGNTLLYHKFLDEGQNSQLWLLNTNTLTAREVTPPTMNATAGQLSPDGSKIVYVRSTSNTCQVIVHALSGNEKTDNNKTGNEMADNQETRLFDCASDSYPTFSWYEDNSGFYYRDRKDKTQPYRIYAYDIDTQNQQQITLPGKSGNLRGDYALSVNKSTGNLAVVRYLDEDNSIIKLIDGKSGNKIKSFKINYPAKHLTWNLQQKTLLFSAKEDVFQVNMATQKVEQFAHIGKTIQSFNYLAPAESPARLFYSDVNINADIWVKNLTNATPARPWQQSSKLELMPRLANLSDRAAMLSTRQGKHQLWLKTADNTDASLVDLPIDIGFSRLVWSADDSQLLFSKQGAIYSLNTSNNLLSKILDEAHNAYVVNIGEHENQLIYSSDKSGQWQLWLRDRLTNQERQITSNGGYSGYIYNGQLIYSKFHQDGLWQKSLDSDSESLLLAEFDKINWLNWHIRADNLYYYQPNSGVWRYNFQSSKQQLVLARNDAFIHQFHVSANQQHIYFVQKEPNQGDIYKMTF